ncbi:MAG: hypothetical protein ACRCZ0_07670 [Cetobacterium sp.]
MKKTIIIFLCIVNSHFGCGNNDALFNAITNLVTNSININNKNSDTLIATDILNIIKESISLSRNNKNPPRNNKNQQNQIQNQQNQIQNQIQNQQNQIQNQQNFAGNKFYKKTENLYIINSIGISKPISISDLAIFVKKGQTIRASYFIKIQTSNNLYAPSFGFLLPNSNDKLAGIALWSTDRNGRKITMYSFMSANPRYYSNQNRGVVDSELAFSSNNYSDGIFNTIKIDIEYSNTHKDGEVILEMNRDLYAYSGQTICVLEGSSVVWETYY